MKDMESILIQLVEEFNALYFEKTEDEWLVPFSYKTTGFWLGIDFLSEIIIDSEEDLFHETEDRYLNKEELRDIINERVLRLINKLNKGFQPQ